MPKAAISQMTKMTVSASIIILLIACLLRTPPGIRIARFPKATAGLLIGLSFFPLASEQFEQEDDDRGLADDEAERKDENVMPCASEDGGY
jgi:hypothetical protein